MTHNAPPLPRGCSAPRAACHTLVSIHLAQPGAFRFCGKRSGRLLLQAVLGRWALWKVLLVKSRFRQQLGSTGSDS